MSLNDLRKLASAKRLSAFTNEKMITEFGLYESVIISLEAEICEKPKGKEVVVSNDVKALQGFVLNDKPMLLPCPECYREMPFVPKGWINLKKVVDENVEEKAVPDRIPSNMMQKQTQTQTATTRHSVFDEPKPRFSLFSEKMFSVTEEEEETWVKLNPRVWQDFNDICVRECRKNILTELSEFRCDYGCTYDSSHGFFVIFRIYDPIHPGDEIEYEKQRQNRKNELTQAYEFLRNCLIIQKIGQFPSLADMQLLDVAKYQKILDKERFRDLNRAIGLYAHGIGCGSFVYLRRVLETLVEEEHLKELAKEDWDEEVYQKSRFNERIRVLQKRGVNIIPPEIEGVKDRIYGVLSKGVHESTDEECKELFPYVHLAIQLILDKKVEQKEREKRILEMNRQLSQ